MERKGKVEWVSSLKWSSEYCFFASINLDFILVFKRGMLFVAVLNNEMDKKCEW
jgi:hypothetical protein